MIRSFFIVLTMAGAACSGSHAQSVALAGLMGGKALLVVEGGAPKLMAVGDNYQGVKLLAVQDERATITVAGTSYTLRLGDAPAGVRNGNGQGSGSSGVVPTPQTIVLPAGTGGHFYSRALINGKPVQVLVDTGATSVALGADEAQRLGLDFKAGTPVRVATANGSAQAWRIKLSSLRMGDVELYDVDAVVTAAYMPMVLLGNSFLSRFQMTRTNDQMVLVKRF